MAQTNAARPPRLYSYIVRVDDGAAPNPYQGMCTLAICKPAIRRTARTGDWIIGTGSSAAGLSGRLVYAMRVDEVVTMEEYDRRAGREWPHRIPDPKSPSHVHKSGDCIYDYSAAPWPRQRPGVHNEGNRLTDLGGKNVLISRHYTYFGSSAIELPTALEPLVHTTQGHKWKMNAPLFDHFRRWIDRLPRGMHGVPGYQQPEEFWKGERGCRARCADDNEGQTLCIRRTQKR